MLSNSARIFKKERKKKYVCGTQWQKEIRGGGHERYFLLKYIRWKVVLSDTKKEGNSCPWTRINRLNYVTISRTAVRLGCIQIPTRITPKRDKYIFNQLWMHCWEINFNYFRGKINCKYFKQTNNQRVMVHMLQIWQTTVISVVWKLKEKKRTLHK